MEERIVVECPNCHQPHKLPVGRKGRVKCSSCGTRFEADTRVKGKVSSISDGELKKLLHPSEASRFVLALVFCIPAVFIAVSLVFASMGIFLIYFAILLFSVWFILQTIKANLTGSAVRVSEHNFPEVHDIVLEVKQILNYNKEVEVFIVEGGSVNAFLYRFFSTKFIMLNSDLVDGMNPDVYRAQLMWIIGRFIGALKAKLLRLQLLSLIVSSIQQIKIFNLFILPYERATQYSGDQIGFAITSDLPASMMAFDKLLIGKDLAKDVQLKGLLSQASTLNTSFFGWFSKKLSTHPHMTDRYLNLIEFSYRRYPEAFEAYVDQFDSVTVTEIGALLPKKHVADKQVNSE